MTQATVPAPQTWSTGNLVFVPWLRADVINAVAFITQRPLFVGQSTLGTSWSNNTDNPLTLNAELADSWNGHNSPSAQYWAPAAGWYVCRATTAFGLTSGTTPYPLASGFQGTTGGTAWGPARGAIIMSPGAGLGIQMAQCTDLVQMTSTGPPNGSGDWVEGTALQVSGGALPLGTGALSPTVSVRWACTGSASSLAVPSLTTCPSPITSAWLNSNVRDTVNFLANPPACKAVYTPGTASMPANSLTTPSALPCGTAVLDNYSGWNGTTFTYTAPVAGIYELYCQWNSMGLTTGVTTGLAMAAGVQVNSGTPLWGDIVTFPKTSTGYPAGATFAKRVRLNAGDAVQPVGSQATGSALQYNTSSVLPTRFIAVWSGS